MLVAGFTRGLSMIQFVAVQARVHGRHAGDFRHALHLRHLAMARFTFYTRDQMRAVTPFDAR